MYRHFVSSLAQRSWNTTGLPVTCIAPEDGIIVPTDDDDWFHPDIGRRLAEVFAEPLVDVVHWDCWVYLPCPMHILWHGHPYRPTGHAWYASNAYAVRAPVPEFVLHSHSDVKGWYVGGYHKCAVYLPEQLSVWVCHPGSMYSLTRTVFEPALLAVRSDPEPPLAGLSWAGVLANELTDFTAQLVPTRSISLL